MYICYFNRLFLYIGERLFKYLFLEIFIICQHFFKLLLIIFVMNFAFVNMFYLNNVSFGVDNIKTISGTYSLTIMAEDFSSYGQEVFIPVLSHLKIPCHWIMFFRTILF